MHAQYNGGLPPHGAGSGGKVPAHGGSIMNGQGPQHADAYASGFAGNAPLYQPGQYPNQPAATYGPTQLGGPPANFAGQQVTQQMGSLSLASSAAPASGPPVAAQQGTYRPPYGGVQQPLTGSNLPAMQQYHGHPGQQAFMHGQPPAGPQSQVRPASQDFQQGGQLSSHGMPQAAQYQPSSYMGNQPRLASQPASYSGGAPAAPPSVHPAGSGSVPPPAYQGQQSVQPTVPSQQHGTGLSPGQSYQGVPPTRSNLTAPPPAQLPTAGPPAGAPPTNFAYSAAPPTAGGPPTGGYTAGSQAQSYEAAPPAAGYSGGYAAAQSAPPAGYSGGYTGAPPPSAAGYTGSYAGTPSGAGYPGTPSGAGYPGSTPSAAPPGSGPGYGYGPAAAPLGSLPSPAPKRLDPDQMPSPIQVILDDRRNRQGNFPTGIRGQVPPLVTTDFVVQDQGNCNPRFMRSTMYSVPVSNDMMKQAKVPFGLVTSPYARLAPGEIPPPCVNLGELGPVRCNRCRAYMCSFMQFIDGGRRFMCPFCNAVTDVPQDYFAHLDHTGKRVDAYMRPELCLGSYEILATKDYCKNGVHPNVPAFIFMIDVSYNSVKSGLVNLLCDHIKDDILPNLPREHDTHESSIRVGFVTYSNVLHFYNVKGSLALPQMLVVTDVEDVFVPMVDGFLVKPSEAAGVIDSLLQQLPALFAESRETEIVLGPVIQAGMDALKSAGCPGKLFIFHTALPTANAPGKLKNRDDRKLLGTEKEKTILTPQDAFYTKLGQECTAAGCGVDLFLFPNSYIDVATLSEVPRLTGGQVFKYEYFQADVNGDRFIQDLKNAVQKPIAFDCILRVRTSTGIRPVDFFGNFNMTNTTDVEMAVLDCDKSFCCEVKHDDKLSESDGAFIQVALLFTSMGGQRKLRVHNLSLNCCTQMSDLFRSCELDTLVNLLSKMATRNTLHKTPKEVREDITVRCCEILAAYRKYCATSSAPGQLILPECMKLLPLYSNCIIRSDALQGVADVSTDDRSYLMHLLNGMDVAASAVFFYPRLIPLHIVDANDPVDIIPDPIRCSIERLSTSGVYLLENGISMFLWLGIAISHEMVEGMFGVPSLAQVDMEKAQLIELDNPISRRVCGIVKAVREQRQRYMKLTIVRQRDKLEPWFQHFLVEDKDAGGGTSYVDFLCHVHREIRSLLN